MRLIIFMVFIIMSLVTASIVVSLAQEHEVIEGGRYLYKKYCSTCHGPQARGDGPRATSLKTPPANLTLLSHNHDGNFPFWEIYRVIDGREEVLNHGPREMPVWGVWFQIPDDEVSTETEWADQVRGRIWQLLTFLQSIQKS